MRRPSFVPSSSAAPAVFADALMHNRKRLPPELPLSLPSLPPACTECIDRALIVSEITGGGPNIGNRSVSASFGHFGTESLWPKIQKWVKDDFDR